MGVVDFTKNDQLNEFLRLGCSLVGIDSARSSGLRFDACRELEQLLMNMRQRGKILGIGGEQLSSQLIDAAQQRIARFDRRSRCCQLLVHARLIGTRHQQVQACQTCSHAIHNAFN